MKPQDIFKPKPTHSNGQGVQIFKKIGEVLFISIFASLFSLALIWVLKPCNRLILCTSGDAAVTGIDQIASLAIDAAQNSISMMEWFIIAFITLSGALIAYIFNAFYTANKEIVSLRSEMDQAKLILDQNAQLIKVLRKTALASTRMFLPSTAIKARTRGKIPHKAVYESFQLLNFQKWIILGEETGFTGLDEVEPGGLTEQIRILIVLQIEEIRNQIRDRADEATSGVGEPLPEEVELMQKLNQLLTK